MEMWIVWLIVAAVLMILEVLTQMMWAMCLAVGCAGGVLAALCGLDIIWQLVFLAIASVAAYVLLVPLFQRLHAQAVARQGKTARTGMDALLGRHSFIEDEIRPDRPGRGRIDGDNWQMLSPGTDDTIRRGTEVVVTGYDSIILYVRPINRKD